MALPRKITADQSHALYDVAATRQIEQGALATGPSPGLMQRAGLATAKLALALAPHARKIWVACGPGNNGGDGFEAALALHRAGKTVCLTWTGCAQTDAKQPDAAQQARLRAEAAGLQVTAQPPQQFDLAVDALLGLGGSFKPNHPSSAQMAAWLQHMSSCGTPVLCVDLPTGLDADSGIQHKLHANSSLSTHPMAHAQQLRHTLCLLTLKPGLFTADGRDWAGQVWLDELEICIPADIQPCATLQGAEVLQDASIKGFHASHKGSYGDVVILGGETAARGSMAGAAVLAARAALHGGAGRVYVALLGAGGPLTDPLQPELMFRAPEALDLTQQVVVAGCGGGPSIRKHLPWVLSRARSLVLDADALNAIAEDSALQELLAARRGRGFSTVLTPHPLEAARLLKLSTAQVQADRRDCADVLAKRFGCVLVLKGSGSVIAAPEHMTAINHSGNALLATAGTGDVLAGLVGAAMAQGLDARAAAVRSCFQHGQVADEWLEENSGPALTASRLAARLKRC